MKTLMLLYAIALLPATQSSVRYVTNEMSISNPYPYRAQDDKIKIKKEHLPEAVLKTLEGDAFKGWSIVNAYKMENGEYEVVLKKDSLTETLRFDKEGKVK